MCKQHNKTHIDKCMKNIVNWINNNTHYKTVMCCCGHDKYKSSLIVIDLEVAEWCRCPYDIFNDYYFKHKQRKFYKKDNEGFYYIPEIEKIKRVKNDANK
jgi:hypothetical protein